jgi:2-keto-4-pentenoate hydratase/2-oxohepta-3-ene-1,7-dioic acid hydratase in catechol pathway
METQVRLITFSKDGVNRIGVLDGGEACDVTAVDPEIPRSMIDFLEAGERGFEAARAAIATAPRFDVATVELRAPVAPRKLLALGINYREHIAEMQALMPAFVFPDTQVWFNKQVTSVTGPFDPIHKPKVSDLLDYEGELAIVIGKRCRHVSEAEAASVIAGYTICNDVSVRDWQMATPTQTMGKSFDTHAPLGPAIVTSDEVGDPQDLRVRVWVNGEARQDFSTSDMVFSCFKQIEHLSKAFTLEPGDVITTGTSVGNGVLRVPPVLLKAGDLVRVEIDRIGAIENRVVDEPETALFQR